MKLRLVSRDPLARRREIVIGQFPCEFGRGAEAAIQIDDRWLSRRHCRLFIDDGVLFIRDLNSRHGTFINGQPVHEATLMPGDELCIGLTHLIAEYEPKLASAHA